MFPSLLKPHITPIIKPETHSIGVCDGAFDEHVPYLVVVRVVGDVVGDALGNIRHLHLIILTRSYRRIGSIELVLGAFGQQRLRCF